MKKKNYDYETRYNAILSACEDFLKAQYDKETFARGAAEESLGEDHYEIRGQYTIDGNPFVVDFF